MTGFYQMHRGWQDADVFGNAEYSERDAWVWLIEAACWQPKRARVKGDMVALERGQMTFSVRFLAEKWGWSKSRVDRFLKRLSAENMISTCSKIGTTAGHAAGQGQSIITVCNYDKYQAGELLARDNDNLQTGTTAGQQRDKEEEGNKGIRKKGSYEPKARAARCPDDWKPSPLPDDLAQAVACLPPGWIERQLAGMRDWSASSPNGAKLNWDATWRGWIRREIEKGNHNGKPTRPMDTGPGKQPVYRRSIGLEMLRELRDDLEADTRSQGGDSGTSFALPMPARH